ncbi:MAG TPA: glycosyltransferase [Candidatus Merdisoma merdipullorum]|nr:glycosyltransferase [Candidatus Merdisoma merdipullorum]
MISVIIPVYNGQKTIENTLESLINQTYRDIEIIVVNDGSKDNTIDLLKAWKEKIRIIDKENGGVSSARNRGIQESQGEYLVFVDADDECKYDMIEKLYLAAKRNDVDYVISGFEKRAHNRNIKYIYEDKLIKTREQIHNELNFIMTHGLNSVFSKIYKKEIIVQNHITFDETLPLGEDYNFNLEYLLSSNSILYISDLLYIYMNENSTATFIYRENYYENRMNSLQKMDRTLKKNNLFNPFYGTLRTKIVFAEIFNLLKKQCPLTKKEKYKKINKIKMDYINTNIHVRGKWKLLKWLIILFSPKVLYFNAFLMQIMVSILPERVRGVSI